MLQDRLEGTVVPGRVIPSEDPEVIVLDLGEDRRARVPAREFGVPPRPGVDVEVFVDLFHPEYGAFSASHDKAVRLRALDTIERAHRDDAIIDGEVVSAVEGGFVVDVGLRAFVPASQVALRPVKDPDQMLGQSLRFKVLRFEKNRANVVLSRRPLLEDEKKVLVRDLRPGAVVEGQVRELKEHGARVDVGGLDGFVFMKDLSWSNVKDASEVLEVGERQRFKVLKIDKSKGRLQLGLRQTHDDPWVRADQKYPPGTLVKGMVVSKTDFGCFVEFEPGLEGLIFATPPLATDSAREVLRRADIGDELEALVVEVNLLAKRIGLRLREG
ncbi:MAG: S1 RNA-binding domain-containing protein [Myxococcales bacterium]|nr:S1 RNA-binding domain-containing protein [Myxococcales bacterium]